MHPGQGRPLPLDVRALGGQELDMTADVSAERADRIDSAPQVIVNGQPYPLDGTPAYTTALDFIRDRGLIGAKEGCAEGECGACSVMVARPDGLADADRTQWTAINACLVPIAAFDGQEIVTAEGIGMPDRMHPVQHEMAVRGGSQCGYCTPGFVCSMAAEYYRAGSPQWVHQQTPSTAPTASTCTP